MQFASFAKFKAGKLECMFYSEDEPSTDPKKKQTPAKPSVTKDVVKPSTEFKIGQKKRPA